MIVVDTNVLVYYAIHGQLTAAALALSEREPDWHAPHLWRSEFRNVLAGEMRHGMAHEHARLVLENAAARLAGNEHVVEDAPILRLIEETRCTAYDLEFVALAQDLRAPFYTMDRQLLTAFPGLARPLIPV